METPFTVYKLIILYMLSHSDTELTNSQLSEFILDRDYTNYFHLQQAISELVEAGLIYKRVKSNSSYYQITSDGASTLSFFESDLSPEIRKDVSEFLKQPVMKYRIPLLPLLIIISHPRETTLYAVSFLRKTYP